MPVTVNPFIRHGDPVAATVDILTNHTPELAPYDVVNIAGSMTNWQSPQRWIHIIRMGGLKKWPKIEKPRMDIYVYGETDTVCSDILAIAEASLFRAAHNYKGYGVRLNRVAEEVGAVESYDKNSECPRFFLTLRLTTTPDPGTMPTP